MSRSAWRSSTRRTSRPSPAGAAPQIRARDRKVLEVATEWSGADRSTDPASRAMSARIFLRSSRTASGSRPAARWSRVSRPAPSGSDWATSGASSDPTAISSEPPPMSNTASRPDDQPNHRRTARNVSRASSSPGSTSMSTPVRSRTCSSTSSELRRVPDRRRGEPGHLLAALVLGHLHRRRDEARQRLDALVGHRPRGVEVLRETQRLLVLVRRHGRGTPRGVDDEEVPGVRADVENAQPHARNAIARRRVCPCQRPIS